MQFSFTSKVISAILLMIFLIVGAILIVFNLRAQQIAEHEMDRRLKLAGDVFDNLQTQIADKLFTINTYISGNSYFVAYMAESIDNGDTQSLLDQFEEIRNFSACDFMIVTDDEGRPVVDTTKTISKELAEDLPNYVEIVDNSEYLPIGTFRAMNKLYTVVMSPVVSGEYLHGYVLVGYKVDDDTARRIGHITTTDVVILAETDGAPYAIGNYFETGTKPFTDDQLIKAMAAAGKKEVFDFKVNDQRYKALTIPFSGIDGQMVGHYITVKSLNKEMAPFNQIRNGLLLIGVLAILLVSPMGIAAAKRVTRPVNRLVEAIEDVSEGKYDENRIDVVTGDEIGLMADRFRALVRELREQRELIDFLEQSSRSGQTGDQNTTVALEATVSDMQTMQTMATVATQRPTEMGEVVASALHSGEGLPEGFLLGNRYKIRKELGRGGMGVVYEAKDQTLDEDVALKMVLVNDPGTLQMLRQETKLARMVTHRNVVRLFDIVEWEGIQFVSMEFVRGTTVKRVMKSHKKNGLPFTIALRIARQVCKGLSAAHDAGIVHGDIKPENIIINGRGEIKIMDFGVSRIARDDGENEGPVAGTPIYMPPEQFENEGVDVRADIYSLGIMMYEMTTGRVPYSGTTVVDLYRQHLQSDLPPIRERRPDIPEKLAAVIETATQKKREQRFQTVMQMHKALRDLN